MKYFQATITTYNLQLHTVLWINLCEVTVADVFFLKMTTIVFSVTNVLSKPYATALPPQTFPHHEVESMDPPCELGWVVGTAPAHTGQKLCEF